MSLRELATDASCAPDVGSSSRAPPSNPLSSLARSALDAPAGLDQRHAPGHPSAARDLLLSDMPPAAALQTFAGAPPGAEHLLPQGLPPGAEHLLAQGNPPAPGRGGHDAFVDDFLRGRPPPPMPAFFPRSFGTPMYRVPPPAPDAATARFEAAFAQAGLRPPMSPQVHRGIHLQQPVPLQQYPQRPPPAPREPHNHPHLQTQSAGRSGTDSTAAEAGSALRSRARVRAREFFPNAGAVEVEQHVEEFMGLLQESGQNPVVGGREPGQGDSGEWMEQFGALGISDATRSGSRRVEERREGQVDRSTLQSFADAMANIDGSSEWAGGAVLGDLPTLREDDADTVTTVAGGDLDGAVSSSSQQASWADQFGQSGQVDSTSAAFGTAEHALLEDAYGDSFNADLYDYLGHDPAAVGYQFLAQESDQYSSFSAREALQEGIRLRNNGELSRAVQALEAAVKPEQLDKKESSEAWFLLGTTHAECDDDERAIQAFLRCLGSYESAGLSPSISSSGVQREDNPFFASALLALGVSYTNELNTPKALSYLRQWLDAKIQGGQSTIPQSTNPFNWNNTGEASPLDDVQAEHMQLVSRLEKLDRESPGDVDVSIALGVMYNLSRDYEKAANSMRNAVTVRPDDARLWNKLGATLANGNESDDALRAYRKAVDLCPSFIRAWVNVGTAYANRSNFDKAARYYLKALSMHADNQKEASAGTGSAGGSSSSGPVPSPAFPADNDMMHVWGYLRTTLVAMQREDLLPLVETGSTEAFKQYIPF